MSRTVVVVSALVDATLREGQPDTNFILKHTLTELAEHIETTPIRANTLYFTQETIPHVNTSLNFLIQLLENPFLKVDKVCYITEKGAREIDSVKYIIAEKGYTNWEIIEGALTREYVTGTITGELRNDSFQRKKKALYRVPRAAYVQDRIKNKAVLEEAYEDDESFLKDVPPVAVPESTVFESEELGRIVHIAGLYGEERTSLSFLLAQYLSQEGKTVMLEKDTEWHLLTELVTKSGVDCLQIDVDDFIKDPGKALARIRTGKEHLIVLTCVERMDFSYSFIFNVLYANLASSVDYFVREDDFNEVPPNTTTIIAMPASIIGILQSVSKMDYPQLTDLRFVGVNLQQLPETRILNGKAMNTILSDLLEEQVSGTAIVNIYSLQIGGDDNHYDLRSIIAE